jgi:glutamate--cysteine ligase
MTRPIERAVVIESEAELETAFSSGSKPREAWKVGAEHEKIGVIAATGAPAPYEGERGIEALLLALGAHGWAPQREGGRVIALQRGDEKVTLEPGGQMELSGAPLARAGEIDAQLRSHVAEVVAASELMGLAWLGIGFRPFGTLDDVPWVPKGRYEVMRAYLPSRGARAHEMMKRTATVQANLDFADEDDAGSKLRAALGVSSLVTALFASSPLENGRDTGWQSWRMRAWFETDPDRTGLLPFAFEDGPIFRKYASWALDVPMFFVYREGYRPAGGMTFRRFLREGFQGERATRADWELHLSTLFPDVRLKHYLETRTADAGSLEMVVALPQLWKGLLYDDEALTATLALAAPLAFTDRVALREAVARAGLRAPWPGGGTVHERARELVAIARHGLSRLTPVELPTLAPLEEIVATGRTAADAIAELWARSPDPAKLIAALRLG